MSEQIVAYMNKHRRINLFDYLALYGDVKLDALNKRVKIEMSSLNLDGFTLIYQESDSSSEKLRRIDFEPPLQSMGETRKVLTRMAKDSAQVLGYAPVSVDYFKWPTFTSIHEALTWPVVSITVVQTLFPGIVFSPSLPLVWLYKAISPKILEVMANHSLELVGFIIVLHITEQIFWMNRVFETFRVPYETRLKWRLIQIYEGYATILRLTREGNNKNKNI